MKIYSRHLFIASALFGIAFPSIALEESTHRIISEYAIRHSSVNDPDSTVLIALGLGPNVDAITYANLLTGSTLRYMPPSELVGLGAEREDEIPRMLHHFFDVQQDGLAFLGGFRGALPSPTWALAPRGSIDEQQNSYADARFYLKEAITGRARTTRRAASANLFETLGHVVHHIQDMTQPQHVRNDDHCKILACVLVGLDVRPSAYEEFIGDLSLETLPSLQGYREVSPNDFPSPRHFWENAGSGVAEFTSINFISARTNFRGDPINPQTDGVHEFPSPPMAGTYEFVDIEELLGPTGPGQPLSGKVLFAPTLVIDSYDDNYSAVNRFATTFSIFTEDFDSTVPFGDLPIFSTNRVTYLKAAEFLMPRAAAYSVGIIDYFFRGNLEITLPDSGVYSVLDHASTNAPGDGFTNLTMNLRNASADQDMPNGRLTAVARYYVHRYYETTLLGEWAHHEGSFDDVTTHTTRNGRTFDEYRQPVLEGAEIISISEPIEGQGVDSSLGRDVTFDFSAQPIPVNAYNLTIQVVYEGVLGEEEDAIAVAGRDISEPTYYGMINGTDFYGINGTYYTPDEIDADEDLKAEAGANYHEETIFNIEYSVAGVPIASNGILGPRQFNRIAFLTDRGASVPLDIRGQTSGGTFAIPTSFPGFRNELENIDAIAITPVPDTRGVVGRYTVFSKFVGVPPSAASDALLPPINPECIPNSCQETPQPMLVVWPAP